MTTDTWAREVAEDIVKVYEKADPKWFADSVEISDMSIDEFRSWMTDTICESIEDYEHDDVSSWLMDEVMGHLITCARSGGECAEEASCLLDSLWNIGIGQEVEG